MNTRVHSPALRKLTVTDGAWGTELQARGLAAGESPDAWNLRFPEKVGEVAGAYARAGSEVILTNTFGANRIRLAEVGLAHEVQSINREGVQISLAAARGKAAVYASIGPSGKMLLAGEIAAAGLRAAFLEQAMALAQAGAHRLVVETMCDLDECRIAVQAACETGLPVVACMVFDSGKDKDRTMMGVTPEQAAEALMQAGATVVGANCGQGIATAVQVCRRLAAATFLPVWIKPNAGLPELVNGLVRYQTLPDDFARFVPELVNAGAAYIGGCCGTSPAFIAAVSEKVSAIREAKCA